MSKPSSFKVFFLCVGVVNSRSDKKYLTAHGFLICFAMLCIVFYS